MEMPGEVHFEMKALPAALHEEYPTDDANVYLCEKHPVAAEKRAVDALRIDMIEVDFD